MVFKLGLPSFEGMDRFENDVKLYGIQADCRNYATAAMFENDVKLYGIQAHLIIFMLKSAFENDVKLYGIQALELSYCFPASLRMM